MIPCPEHAGCGPCPIHDQHQVLRQTLGVSGLRRSRQLLEFGQQFVLELELAFKTWRGADRFFVRLDGEDDGVLARDSFVLKDHVGWHFDLSDVFGSGGPSHRFEFGNEFWTGFAFGWLEFFVLQARAKHNVGNQRHEFWDHAKELLSGQIAHRDFFFRQVRGEWRACFERLGTGRAVAGSR
jgi:hypothetical protein